MNKKTISSEMNAKADFEKIQCQMVMHVISENGLNRTLLFKKKSGSTDDHFYITTWPGHLSMSGDRGTYVFSRVSDMIYFFTGRFNPYYWAEKLQTEGIGHRAIEVIDSEGVEENIRQRLHQFFQGENYTLTQKKYLVRYIKEELFNREFNHEYELYSELARFDSDHWDAPHSIEPTGFELDDVHELIAKDFSYSFFWACRAIQWACRYYLSHKQSNQYRLRLNYQIIDIEDTREKP